MNNGRYNTADIDLCNNYILVKGDIIEVNPYATQLLHRVQCIWLKDQILAAVFMTGFTLHPEAII